MLTMPGFRGYTGVVQGVGLGVAESGRLDDTRTGLRSVMNSPGVTDGSSLVVMERTKSKATDQHCHWASKYCGWWSHSRLVFIVGLLLLTLWEPASATLYEPNSGPHEYCTDETFQASCPDGHVIQMTSARYGRMILGKCLKSNYGHIGCGNDVTDTFHRKCSGRRECEVVNIERTVKESGWKEHCPADLKSYLEADYTCLIGEKGLDNECQPHGEVKLAPSSGYIASGIEIRDTSDCPITIKAKEGQKIRITLIDYTDFDSDVTDSGGDPSYCREYAAITETRGEFKGKVVGCRGQNEAKEVYVSQGNEVKIDLKSTSTSEFPSFYLLKYEVFGCVVPAIQPGMYLVEMTSASVHVRCNHTDNEWVLKCQDSVWHGSLGNCSSAAPEVAETVDINRLLPYGISILIIIAVAVLICILILVFGIMHIKRKQRARDRLNQNHLLAPPGTPSVDSKIATLKRNTSVERSYSPMSRTMRIPASGGDYAHIWELRRPIPVETPEVPTDMSNRQLPDPKEEQNRTNTDPGDKWARVSSFKPHVDHIYESPKFERRMRSGAAEQGPDGPTPFYYELDPNSPEVATLPRGAYPVCTCGVQQAALPLRQVPLGSEPSTSKNAKDTASA